MRCRLPASKEGWRDGLPEATGLPIRDRYTAFIARHDVAWEIAIAVIVVAWIAIGFIGEGSDVTSVVETVLTLVLATEFVTRFAASRDRRAYFRGHWIDAVALIPYPQVRGIRLIRMLRLLRLIRAFSGVYRALVSVERFATDRRLIWLFTSWLAVAFICATALYFAEEGSTQRSTSRWTLSGGESSR